MTKSTQRKSRRSRFCLYVAVTHLIRIELMPITNTGPIATPRPVAQTRICRRNRRSEWCSLTAFMPPPSSRGSPERTALDKTDDCTEHRRKSLTIASQQRSSSLGRICCSRTSSSCTSDKSTYRFKRCWWRCACGWTVDRETHDHSFGGRVRYG
jgi:hypothetical protein